MDDYRSQGVLSELRFLVGAALDFLDFMLVFMHKMGKHVKIIRWGEKDRRYPAIPSSRGRLLYIQFTINFAFNLTL